MTAAIEAQAQAQSAPIIETEISDPQRGAKNFVGDPRPGSPTMAIEELIDFCLKLKPDLAAERRDSSLCVTPLITQIIVDGKLVRLALIEGRFAAGYIRVSDDRQRSARSITLAPSSGIAAKERPEVRRAT